MKISRISMFALAFVAFLAVFREGAETALFYQALFTRGGDIVMPVSLGLLSGSATLAVIFTLFWVFGLRIPLRPFFAVTSALLYYMALVFAGTGIKELQEADILPRTMLPGFPHVELIGPVIADALGEAGGVTSNRSPIRNPRPRRAFHRKSRRGLRS